MHTDYSTFALEIHDGVAEVAFDNPPMNLFDAGLLTELSRFVALHTCGGAVSNTT